LFGNHASRRVLCLLRERRYTSARCGVRTVMGTTGRTSDGRTNCALEGEHAAARNQERLTTKVVAGTVSAAARVHDVNAGVWRGWVGAGTCDRDADRQRRSATASDVDLFGGLDGVDVQREMSSQHHSAETSFHVMVHTRHGGALGLATETEMDGNGSWAFVSCVQCESERHGMQRERQWRTTERGETMCAQ